VALPSRRPDQPSPPAVPERRASAVDRGPTRGPLKWWDPWLRGVGRGLGRVRVELRLAGLSAWRALHRLLNSDDLTFASSIAYFALLSLFPFFLLAFSILGAVTADEAQRAAVLEIVLHYFPRQFDFITAQLDAIRQGRIRLGVAGSLLMVWASFGVFGAITSAVNHAWGVEKQPSFWQHKLVSFVLLAGAGLLLIVVLIVISAVKVLEAEGLTGLVGGTPLIEGIRGFALQHGTTVVLIVVLGLLFYFLPNAKVRFRDVWLGAILTGLLWRGALAGFSWFVRDITRWSLIHGSLGAVVVFLSWVYVSAIILLYGVEFTAAYARLRRHRPEQIPAAPAPRV
jgi:membrane protein